MSNRAPIVLTGIGASAGIAVGPAYLLDRGRVRTPRRPLAPGEAESELERLEAALALADRQLLEMKRRVEAGEGPEHALILEAHRLMLQDPEFGGAAKKLVRDEQMNAEWAIRRCARKLRSAFGRLGDEYFRERRHDVTFVADRVVRNLMGRIPDAAEEIPTGVVLVARDLSPADAAVLLQPGRILGLVTDRGAKTSHTAIVAHARGIPAVMGAVRASELAAAGDEIALDGERGTVALRPEPHQLVRFAEAKARFARTEQAFERERTLPSRTLDGSVVRLNANLEFEIEIPGVARAGASGIGLFRTEFLYLGRTDLPSEDEHYEVYRNLVIQMEGRPVTIRTVDLGADKMPMDRLRRSEPNPALGLRALRLCRRNPEVFRTQLRAILRASVHGPVRVLFPLVSGMIELRAARAALEAAREELRAEGIPTAQPEVGAMIEVPSAALLADRIAAEVDFLSIGTNDLIQYSLAIDRQNREVAYLYQPLHLSILRMMQLVVDAGHARGIPVSVCGEMAGEAQYTLMLLGLGVDELSMAASAIPLVRRVIRASTISDGRELLQAAMALDTADDIERYVRTTMEERYGQLLGGDTDAEADLA
ncbi:phosphoenolpyruvate--protein phosphotransferase [Vulgatibacter incomptus]|uniref:Phosphoenolpyruvate-protein phosphotransferase n=1 Tax=Vulgatibacter incomptus TaxID=1391653 RepID=A0A0K1PFC1_9BACT|nr:phosphoenolpyruvate--protein phosphotransferase [Vulgatibacter incomptus]AKU92223.1 Phosphoenolpyruvate-protein phosphotransferase of PTS system [Vulgatibacter incomptus]